MQNLLQEVIYKFHGDNNKLINNMMLETRFIRLWGGSSSVDMTNDSLRQTAKSINTPIANRHKDILSKDSIDMNKYITDNNSGWVETDTFDKYKLRGEYDTDVQYNRYDVVIFNGKYYELRTNSYIDIDGEIYYDGGQLKYYDYHGDNRNNNLALILPDDWTVYNDDVDNDEYSLLENETPLIKEIPYLKEILDNRTNKEHSGYQYDSVYIIANDNLQYVDSDFKKDNMNGISSGRMLSIYNDNGESTNINYLISVLGESKVSVNVTDKYILILFNKIAVENIMDFDINNKNILSTIVDPEFLYIECVSADIVDENYMQVHILNKYNGVYPSLYTNLLYRTPDMIILDKNSKLVSKYNKINDKDYVTIIKCTKNARIRYRYNGGFLYDNVPLYNINPMLSFDGVSFAEYDELNEYMNIHVNGDEGFNNFGLLDIYNECNIIPMNTDDNIIKLDSVGEVPDLEVHNSILKEKQGHNPDTSTVYLCITKVNKYHLTNANDMHNTNYNENIVKYPLHPGIMNLIYSMYAQHDNIMYIMSTIVPTYFHSRYMSIPYNILQLDPDSNVVSGKYSIISLIIKMLSLVEEPKLINNINNNVINYKDKEDMLYNIMSTNSPEHTYTELNQDNNLLTQLAYIDTDLYMMGYRFDNDIQDHPYDIEVIQPSVGYNDILNGITHPVIRLSLGNINTKYIKLFLFNKLYTDVFNTDVGIKYNFIDDQISDNNSHIDIPFVSFVKELYRYYNFKIRDIINQNEVNVIPTIKFDAMVNTTESVISYINARLSHSNVTKPTVSKYPQMLYDLSTGSAVFFPTDIDNDPVIVACKPTNDKFKYYSMDKAWIRTVDSKFYEELYPLYNSIKSHTLTDYISIDNESKTIIHYSSHFNALMISKSQIDVVRLDNTDHLYHYTATVPYQNDPDWQYTFVLPKTVKDLINPMIYIDGVLLNTELLFNDSGSIFDNNTYCTEMSNMLVLKLPLNIQIYNDIETMSRIDVYGYDESINNTVIRYIPLSTIVNNMRVDIYDEFYGDVADDVTTNNKRHTDEEYFHLLDFTKTNSMKSVPFCDGMSIELYTYGGIKLLEGVDYIKLEGTYYIKLLTKLDDLNGGLIYKFNDNTIAKNLTDNYESFDVRKYSYLHEIISKYKNTYHPIYEWIRTVSFVRDVTTSTGLERFKSFDYNRKVNNLLTISDTVNLEIPDKVIDIITKHSNYIKILNKLNIVGNAVYKMNPSVIDKDILLKYGFTEIEADNMITEGFMLCSNLPIYKI